MANYVSDSTKADIGEAKKKITPQYIYDTLAAKKKETLVGYPLLFFSALAMLFVFFIIHIAASPFNERETKIANIVLTAILLSAVVIALYACFRIMRKVSDDDYTIVVDKIETVSIDDKKVSVHGRKYHTVVYMEHAVYLCRCGRVAISYEDVKFQSIGDTIYVLVAKKHPNKPIMIYNTKHYELVGFHIEEF